MLRELKLALVAFVVLTVLTGALYPALVTALAEAIFPDQAHGSLVSRDGHVVGSSLIAQGFTADGYFQPRPSAAGKGWDAANSSGSNLAPSAKALVDGVKDRLTAAQATNPGAPVPIDLVTASGSGLDPDLSPAAASFQIPRVATARHVNEAEIRAIVTAHTEGRTFGFLGEPRVNVLLLNMALDERYGRPVIPPPAASAPAAAPAVAP